MSNLMTTKKLAGLRVVDAVKGKKIGKVRHFVFHPTEKRCIGFTVKRPDAALMFHRKDMFVALGGFHLEEGQVAVHDDPAATDKGAVKALGVKWENCVIWVGMPVLTQSGQDLGYVEAVAFDAQTGAVHSLLVGSGAANDAILGRRSIPASLVRGFKRGCGSALAPVDDYDQDEGFQEDNGAILVADEAAGISAQGGAAAAAGKASAVAADKARKGAEKAKSAVSDRVEKAKPAAERAVARTDEAVQAGSYAVGRQLGRATGMFAAFKEEFEKASKGEGD